MTITRTILRRTSRPLTRRISPISRALTTSASPLPTTPRDDHAPPPPPSSKPRLAALRQSLASPDNPPFSRDLTDSFSRRHTYLRISITERCNLRCLYCMPSTGVPLSPPPTLLSTPEILELASLFVSEGVTKIRLTGGEPTVRTDIVELVEALGELRSRGLKEIAMTTNGVLLGGRKGEKTLERMVDAGLNRLNLSLDTLVKEKFEFMTRRRGFERVIKTLDRAVEMGFGVDGERVVKLNVVVMRGVNEDEVLDFVEMTKNTPVEVRFIEYMPFDGNKWSQGKMMSYAEMISLIRTRYPDFSPLPTQRANDTSKTYHIPGHAGRIGFITSMTENFCGTCNRLRITGDGNIKVCLFGNEEVSLRDLMREYRDREATFGEGEVERREEMRKALLEVIGAAVGRKEEGHKDPTELVKDTKRPMILIGG